MLFFEEDPIKEPKEENKPAVNLRRSDDDRNVIATILEDILLSENRTATLPKDIGHTVAGFAKKWGYSPILTPIDISTIQIKL